MRFIAIFASVRKDEEKKKRREKKRNFGHSYLGNGLSDFLQIWNVDSPSWRETLQHIWFQLDEVSPRYKCVKMTFSFFLSIYSRCGAPASWAARHTILCLDIYIYIYIYIYIQNIALAVPLDCPRRVVHTELMITSGHQTKSGQIV